MLTKQAHSARGTVPCLINTTFTLLECSGIPDCIKACAILTIIFSNFFNSGNESVTMSSTNQSNGAQVGSATLFGVTVLENLRYDNNDNPKFNKLLVFDAQLTCKSGDTVIGAFRYWNEKNASFKADGIVGKFIVVATVSATSYKYFISRNVLIVLDHSNLSRRKDSTSRRWTGHIRVSNCWGYQLGEHNALCRIASRRFITCRCKNYHSMRTMSSILLSSQRLAVCCRLTIM